MVILLKLNKEEKLHLVGNVAIKFKNQFPFKWILIWTELKSSRDFWRTLAFCAC